MPKKIKKNKKNNKRNKRKIFSTKATKQTAYKPGIYKGANDEKIKLKKFLNNRRKKEFIISKTTWFTQNMVWEK